MTAYELIDALSSLRMEAGNHVLNFISVMFGYVATAYFVGPKLTRFQVSAINILYTIFTPGPLMAAYEAATNARKLAFAFEGTLPFSVAEAAILRFGPELVVAMVTISWTISIVFMIQMRRDRQKDNRTKSE